MIAVTESKLSVPIYRRLICCQDKGMCTYTGGCLRHRSRRRPDSLISSHCDPAARMMALRYMKEFVYHQANKNEIDKKHVCDALEYSARLVILENIK